MNAITLHDVTVSYSRHPAVHHISGTFVRGSLTAIAGPNGAGKSTLLKTIAGIKMPDEGSITFEDSSRPNIAYLSQASELQREFPLTLLHLVATGYWHRAGGHWDITPAMKKAAAEALADVGLAGFEKRPLASLSAGQFQRALFARLLIQHAPLILLDEPFNAVDTETTGHLLALVQRWHTQGRTVICVLHDFEQIRKYFPECLLLARECVAWGKTEAVLTPEWLHAARFFHESSRVAAEACNRVTS